MATFEKTWAFDLNRAYVPSNALDLTRYTMWLLAAQLTGNIGGLTLGLWTLYASSDSVTAGTDATDRWVLAGPYNGAKIVRGATTAIHSWIVLRSPSMNGNVWYMTLSFNSASDAAVRWSFMKTAPTGGSTTVTPTSTDQWWPINSGGGLGAVDHIINAAATDNSRFNMGLTSEGGFYFLGCKQGTSLPNLCVIFAPISNRKTNDLFPVWTSIQYLATGVCRCSSNVAGEPFNWSTTSTAGGQISRHATLLATASDNCFIQVAVSSTAVTAFQPTVADVIDGTYPDYPLWIATGSAGIAPHSIRGRVADFAYSSNSTATLPEASVSPVSGSVDSCRVGQMWFPANAAFNFA